MLGTVFAVITSPITLVLGIIAGGIALFTYFYRTNEKFRNGIQSLWKLTQKAFGYMSKAWTDLGNAIDWIVNSVFSGLEFAFNAVVNGIISKINLLIRAINAVSSYIPGVGESLQIQEFEKIGVEHRLQADQAAETRALVSKSLINMTVAITGNVEGVKNFQANVTPDSYKSSGGKNAFVLK